MIPVLAPLPDTTDNPFDVKALTVEVFATAFAGFAGETIDGVRNACVFLESEPPAKTVGEWRAAVLAYRTPAVTPDATSQITDAAKAALDAGTDPADVVRSVLDALTP